MDTIAASIATINGAMLKTTQHDGVFYTKAALYLQGQPLYKIGNKTNSYYLGIKQLLYNSVVKYLSASS